MNIDNIVISQTQPKDTRVLWIQQKQDYTGVKIYQNGIWVDLLKQNGISETKMHINSNELTQTWKLHKGFNYWSTYLYITVADLEEALGTSGLSINSQTASNYYLSNYSAWTSRIQNIDFSQMYQIEMAEDLEIELTGNKAPIQSLNVGKKTWIGCPYQHEVTLEYAFSQPGFVQEGDTINDEYKNKSTYQDGVWIGSIHTLKPGCGYVYNRNTNSNEPVVFSFPNENNMFVQSVISNNGNLDVIYSNIEQEVNEYSDNPVSSKAVYQAIQQAFNNNE